MDPLGVLLAPLLLLLNWPAREADRSLISPEAGAQGKGSRRGGFCHSRGGGGSGYFPIMN